MKRLALIFLAICLVACSSSKVDYYQQIKDSSLACVENLKEDQLIQACLDLDDLSQEYISNKEDVDYRLFENIINDLIKVSDISNNTALVEKNNSIIKQLKNTVKFEDNSLSTYKDNIDQEKYKKLANNFIEKTTLKLKEIKKTKTSYKNEDFIVEVIFEDDNNIQVVYVISFNNKLKRIEINNLAPQKEVFINYAKLYSKLILLNNLNVSNRNGDYDSFLIERKLQFNNGENFRSDFQIEVSENSVVFKDLEIIVDLN